MVNVPNNNRLSVLLAHDSDGWQETVRRLLEPQGVQTVAVRSGREALDVLQHTQVHVAVLDQQMPQLGGLQVIKLMRDIKAPPPSILLANHLTDHLLHDALGLRVFSVLSKPVDLNLLLDALARVLKRHYASRWPSES
jgi:two-component system sensor histidine kinase RpfC